MEFTYAAYGNLLDRLEKHHYQFSNYHEYEEFEKPVIIRHDIDADIKKALDLAGFEKERGIRATYFVLVSNGFYNIFAKENEEMLKEICHYGHEVGLHFDEMKYDKEDDLIQCMEKEIELLEICIGGGYKIQTISMHRPSKQTLEANYCVKNGEVINSYSDTFFKNFKYVSDSRRHWRENIDEIIQSGGYDKLHILTHPLWYAEEDIDMDTTLENFALRAVSERKKLIEENIL